MEEKIMSLLSEKKYAQLSASLKEQEPADLAILLEGLPFEDLPLVYRLLPKELAAQAFAYMDSDAQRLLIRAFSDKELEEVLNELFVDDTVDLIEEMPASVVKRILRQTDAQTRSVINQILHYPSDSAGSIMTPEYVDLKKQMTVAQAFLRIRQTGYDKETIYTCYVTDEHRRLEGVISVRTLLLAGQDAVIADLMDTNIIHCSTHDDKESVAMLFDKYDLIAVPVVDAEQCLVGIVTFDDAIDVLQEENTEDFEKMAALSPSEDSYFKTPILQHAKNRILWLMILMLSATLSGTIISHYENAFAAVPLLISFLPMLMDTGGNCGAQSSTLIIRGLALEEIRLKDFFKVWFKEIRIALLVGSAMAAVNFLRVMLMYGDVAMAVLTGLTLICVALLAKTLGCIMPMLAKKLGLDPAIMASPLITTIVDTCAVLIYFNAAIWILNL